MFSAARFEAGRVYGGVAEMERHAGNHLAANAAALKKNQRMDAALE